MFKLFNFFGQNLIKQIVNWVYVWLFYLHEFDFFRLFMAKFSFFWAGNPDCKCSIFQHHFDLLDRRKYKSCRNKEKHFKIFFPHIYVVFFWVSYLCQKFSCWHNFWPWGIMSNYSINVINVDDINFGYTVKLGYNEQLGTVHFCSL